MTGEEYLHLTDGDLCKLTEDINTNGLIWHKGDIIEVVYRNRYEESIYVKNNSVDYNNRHPYKTLEAIFFLKAMELYKKWNEVKKNTFVTRFSHRFMPGDIFWVMRDNRPKSFTIDKIEYIIQKYSSILKYHTIEGYYFNNEEEIFATKDELLNSLR